VYKFVFLTAVPSLGISFDCFSIAAACMYLYAPLEHILVRRALSVRISLILENWYGLDFLAMRHPR
jgi:hypothetical protein